MNLVFGRGKYNGSVLTVLGWNAPLHEVQEMAVVEGTGLFLFARGYDLAKDPSARLQRRRRHRRVRRSTLCTTEQISCFCLSQSMKSPTVLVLKKIKSERES
ncbi:hypothetical protein MUK42_20071 [Musa troglodytarum]|uniref:Dirigent protein n=1 Tax=Musa troglodytarum TaxID=320322 RepID=A0A9E7EBV5_9LILI|nr:hypothetical protein MUK42_20071 [Musa troglodytarum]